MSDRHTSVASEKSGEKTSLVHRQGQLTLQFADIESGKGPSLAVRNLFESSYAQEQE